MTRPRNAVDFPLNEISIRGLLNGMNARDFSCEEIADEYLARIAQLDPRLHAVLEVNPEAIDIAKAMDQERGGIYCVGHCMVFLYLSRTI